MSVSSSRKLARGNTRSAVDYELFGALGSKKFKMHQANGTNRVAAIRCDLDSPEDYVARAEAVAEANGRKIETKSLIQSFENVEMDPNNPLDVETVSDLGYEFAKRLHPNSDVLVITHVDGEGGHPHNHIKIMNHDDVTGKAIRGNDMYFQFFKVNDELMREHGLSVAERGSRGKAKDQAQYWEHQRDAAGMTEFDTWLGDRVHECLVDMKPKDQGQFEQFLAEHNIELVESEHVIKASADGSRPEHVSVGWTYRAMDEFGPKRRTRRRAASTLSDEFTKARAEKTFERHRELAAASKARVPVAAPVAPVREVILKEDRFLGETTWDPDVLAMGRAGYTKDEIDAAVAAWKAEQAAGKDEPGAERAGAATPPDDGGGQETSAGPASRPPAVHKAPAAPTRRPVAAPEVQGAPGRARPRTWMDDALDEMAQENQPSGVLVPAWEGTDEAVASASPSAPEELVPDEVEASQGRPERSGERTPVVSAHQEAPEQDERLVQLDEQLAELDAFERKLAARGGNASVVRAAQVVSERQQLERARLRITNPGLARQLDRGDAMNAELEGRDDEGRGVGD